MKYAIKTSIGTIQADSTKEIQEELETMIQNKESFSVESAKYKSNEDNSFVVYSIEDKSELHFTNLLDAVDEYLALRLGGQKNLELWSLY